jgi:Zn-dependent metalloprotease
MKKLFIFFQIICAYHLCHAQENEYCKNPDASIFSSVTLNGWVKFKPNIALNTATLFQTNKTSFGLQNNIEMKKIKTEVDDLGFTHSWYREFVNDIPVLFGHFIVHEKNNQLQSGNGKIYTAATINANNLIGPAGAINKALQFVHANKYWWQDTAKENKLKRKLNDLKATYFPKPEILYAYDDITKQIRLGYKIIVQTFDPGKSGILYIYADNGLVFLWDPLEHSSCDASTVNTNWYNNRIIYCYTDAFTSGWDLEDDCTSSTYKMYDYATASNSIFNSSNNQWTTLRQRSAATCLWSIRQTRDVYSNIFGRNGHNNSGGNIDMYFDYIFAGNSTNNANYHYDAIGDDEINIGRGNEDPSILDDYSALDILAHEFTHGVTQYTCNLVYQREPGALNESFSDLLGEYVENKVFNGNNWLLGWDRIVGGVNAPIRNMEAPLAFEQPDRYGGFKWSPASNACNPIGPGNPGNNDYCGVHTNSGVQNRMYYLLSVGGNGWTNDSSSRNVAATGANAYQWSVAGITIDKAARIAYRVMTVYLSSNSNYFDSRNAWVHAAEDLYGACSFEAIQTGKAWYAVGIGPPAGAGGNICGTFGNVPFTYTKPGQVNVANTCTVNILTTGNTVQVNAGNKITLNPGFTSLVGSRFVAHIIDDCVFASY